VVTTLLELFGLEEEVEGSDLPSIRVQTPLYRQGSGYRLGGRLPAPPWPCLWRDPLASDPSSDGGNFIKCLSPLDRHLGGICSPFCLRSFCGEGSCSLVSGVWTWLASCPSLASVDLVGARPLSAKQPLEGSCRLRPALALLGGVASRLLALPALWSEPVFLTWHRGDSWDVSRQTTLLLAYPRSHPHDKTRTVLTITLKYPPKSMNFPC
jgi:hypothetical protein